MQVTNGDIRTFIKEYGEFSFKECKTVKKQEYLRSGPYYLGFAAKNSFQYGDGGSGGFFAKSVVNLDAITFSVIGASTYHLD